MTHDQFQKYADSQMQLSGREALRAIDTLTRHLAEQRAGVEAWMNGEPTRETPGIYGNALGDAADRLAAFRETAKLAATMRLESER